MNLYKERPKKKVVIEYIEELTKRWPDMEPHECPAKIKYADIQSQIGHESSYPQMPPNDKPQEDSADSKNSLDSISTAFRKTDDQEKIANIAKQANPTIIEEEPHVKENDPPKPVQIDPIKPQFNISLDIVYKEMNNMMPMSQNEIMAKIRQLSSSI